MGIEEIVEMENKKTEIGKRDAVVKVIAVTASMTVPIAIMALIFSKGNPMALAWSVGPLVVLGIVGSLIISRLK